MKRHLFLACLPILLKAELGCDSERVWEDLVRGKGGREALRSVDSLAVQWRQVSRGNRSKHQIADLWVLPDLHWWWADLGDKRLGTMAGTFDARAQTARISSSGIARIESEGYPGWPLFEKLVLLIPETRFYKPVIDQCTIDPLHADQFDLTLTVATGGSDPTPSHHQRAAAIRIHVRKSDGVVLAAEHREGAQVSTSYRFANYQPISGLVLPLRVLQIDFLERRVEFQVNYEVNPRYDSHIFERNPNALAGPDQWLPK